MNEKQRIFIDDEDFWKVEADVGAIVIGEDWHKFAITTPESLARFKVVLDKAAELLGWPR